MQWGANDGRQTVTDTFRVQVTNAAPVLQHVADQTMSHRQGSLTLSLTATDADGDPPTFRWFQTYGPPVAIVGVTSAMAARQQLCKR